MKSIIGYITSLLNLGVITTIFLVIYYFLFGLNTYGIELQVHTDKEVYSVGERVGFMLQKCDTDREYKNISYQLQQHTGDTLQIINLGHNKDVGLPVKGCYFLLDRTPVLPDDITPGTYQFLVRVDNARNPFQEPRTYISNEFDVVK